jgi:hypothetical protein
VLNSANAIDDVLLRSLAWGPLRNVTKWPNYVINGYKFVTKSQNEGMSTTNHNVCVRGGQYQSLENDYYGVLTDINCLFLFQPMIFNNALLTLIAQQKNYQTLS